MDFLPLFLRVLMQLPAIVADVEALHGAGAGQQKRQAAIALAGSVLQIADAVSARQIVDPERFTAALGVLVDGIVACLNASLWRKSSPV